MQAIAGYVWAASSSSITCQAGAVSTEAYT